MKGAPEGGGERKRTEDEFARGEGFQLAFAEGDGAEHGTHVARQLRLLQHTLRHVVAETVDQETLERRLLLLAANRRRPMCGMF